MRFSMSYRLPPLPPLSPPLLLTEKAVALQLGVSRSWLQKARVYGGGPNFIKLNGPRGAVRYRQSAVDNFLDRRTIGTDFREDGEI
jgi:predicted DNA-binding transcriptional regulator AlpA